MSVKSWRARNRLLKLVPPRMSVTSTTRSYSPDPAMPSSANLGMRGAGRLSTQKKSMSSIKEAALLFPAPDRPEMITNSMIFLPFYTLWIGFSL